METLLLIGTLLLLVVVLALRLQVAKLRKKVGHVLKPDLR